MLSTTTNDVLTLFKKIFPEHDTTPSGIKILYKHWYRIPDDTTSMADEILYEIPCDLVQDVVMRHEGVAKQTKMALKRKGTSDAGVSLLDLFYKHVKLVSASSKVGQESRSKKG